jgi:5-methylthioadenosine/S-adenosylhomocysteine deaminase
MNNKSIIFKNFTVITPEENRVITYENHHVAVEQGIIQYSGVDLSAAKQSIKDPNPDIYDGQYRILMPCFVNSHTHLAMTLLRNRADDVPLHQWLYDHIFPVEERMGTREFNTGTLLGIAEMIKNGIGVCANMYMTTEDAMDSQTAIDTGIKLNTVFVGGYKNPMTGKYVLDEKTFDRLHNIYHNSGNQRIKCGLLVHSIYLYDKDFYYTLAQFAMSRKTFIHMHISETQLEVLDCVRQYGARPPVVLESMGIFDSPVIAAHCVHLDDQDREILQKKQVTVVHNPSSNMKLGSGFADIKKILDAGINLALGTDGTASNNNLDIFQEMRFASYLAKGIYMDPTVVSVGDIIRAATVNGMRGLGYLNSGQIKTGMDADLQVIDTHNPSMSPVGNYQAAVVYSGSSSCVESLMVSGQMLMRKRELLTIDEEKAIFEAKESSASLYKSDKSL